MPETMPGRGQEQTPQFPMTVAAYHSELSALPTSCPDFLHTCVTAS